MALIEDDYSEHYQQLQELQILYQRHDCSLLDGQIQRRNQQIDNQIDHDNNQASQIQESSLLEDRNQIENQENISRIDQDSFISRITIEPTFSRIDEDWLSRWNIDEDLDGSVSENEHQIDGDSRISRIALERSLQLEEEFWLSDNYFDDDSNDSYVNEDPEESTDLDESADEIQTDNEDSEGDEESELFDRNIVIDANEDLEGIDVSYNRIRPLYHNDGEQEEEEDFDDIQHDFLRTEMRRLRERHERNLRGLLLIRLEQFRLRHQQLLSLLHFLQNPDYQELGNRSHLLELREFFIDVSFDMLQTIQQLMLASSTDADDELEAIERIIEQARMHNLLDEEIICRGLSDTQLDSLSCRKYVPQQGETPACPICITDFKEGDEQSSMDCAHWHCQSCLKKWLRINNSCPVCRQTLEDKDEQNQHELSSRLSLV